MVVTTIYVRSDVLHILLSKLIAYSLCILSVCHAMEPSDNKLINDYDNEILREGFFYSSCTSFHELHRCIDNNHNNK